MRFDTDRPVSEMKELEKALTIGFLPNSQPGMAPLSSTVTPSVATFCKLPASTTSLRHSPITNTGITKLAGEKFRLKPGRGHRRNSASASQKVSRKRGHTDHQNGTTSTERPLKKEPNLASIHHLPTAAVQENVPKKRVKLSEKEKGEKGSTDSEHSQKAKSEGSSKRRHSPFYAYPSLDSTSTLDSPGHFSHEDSCSADLMEEESEAPPSGKRHNKRSKNNSFSASERSILADSLADETLEMEEEDTSSEVIHCVCNQVEEKGLMIQCEVCMCWQHATCMNLDEATLPKKYICSVCRNPKGLRPSARYIYDQDWIKLGQLPRFSFVEPDENDDEIVRKILATNNLVGDLHNIKAVLYGLQQQIKINLNKDGEGLKIWTKNWCNLSESVFTSIPKVKEESRSKLLADLDDEPCFVDPVTVDPQVPDEILADQQADDPVPDVSGEESVLPSTNGMNRGSSNSTQAINKTESTDSLASNQTNSGSPAQGVKENGLSKDSNEVSLPASAPVSTPAMSNGNGDESPLPSDEQPTHSPPSNQNHSRNEDVIDSKDVRPSPKNNDKSVDGWGRRLSSINKEGSMGASAGDSTTDKLVDSLKSGLKSEVKLEHCENADLGCDVKTEEVDPLSQKQTYMLQYVMQMQQEIDNRLNKIREQVDILEEREKVNSPLSVSLPLLKKSLRNMMQDLGKVRRMAAYH